MRQTYLSWDYRGALSADMRVSFQADVILRSATRHHLTVPRYQLSTFGRRAFSVAGPTVWNSLLDSLCDPALTSNSFRVQTIAENDFLNGRHSPSWILQMFIFGHLAVIEFQMCCCVPNFITIGWFCCCWDLAILRFTIWRPSATLNFRDPIVGSLKSSCGAAGRQQRSYLQIA